MVAAVVCIYEVVIVEGRKILKESRLDDER
jgi:hypothetical protein